MKADQFGPSATGSLVPISGVSNEAFAFVPGPLPPKWEWSPELWPLLVEARSSLARLEGTGRHLPSPDLIQKPLQNREAQKSSSLEGTITDPVQQVLFQLDPKIPESAADPANAFREVFNYSRALRVRKDTRKALPLSLRLLRDLHRVLMTGVRGSDKNPGEFRKHQNQIGRPARFVPPPPQRLPALLDNLEKSLHDEMKVDPLVKAFILHYQFEAIHPFMDGNGRVGRLFLAICIAEWCKLEEQWLYMSAYFDDNKDEYLNRLLAVSTSGDWHGWIEFCLRGVVAQAADTQKRCDQLLKLHRGFHKTVAKSAGSVRLSAIVDQLFVAPAVTVTGVREQFEVTYPTARADLRRLETLGILKRLHDVSQITYYCPGIFKAAYAD